MNNKRIHIEKDEPKHRKKSKKKGQPRADHKHEYKTVLLLNECVNHYLPNEPSLTKRATKVCMICGRVSGIDKDQYEHVEIPDMPYRIYKHVIRDEESLEKWYVDDYFDKFAKKIIEVENE